MAATWVVTLEYMKKYNLVAADNLCLTSMFNAQAIMGSILSFQMQDETVNLLMDRAPGGLATSYRENGEAILSGRSVTLVTAGCLAVG